MAKYIIKSKTLSTLNEALKKIMLTEYDAVTTPPEMDNDGNFTSNIETKKEPKINGVEVEKQNKDLSKEELISKAIEKIKDSIDVASDLDSIIQQLIGKNDGKNLSNKWEVNDDHNDVYLQSKDAHIFQQNNNILLSHNGKIELFHTVDELHNWLKENNWPLPPAIEIHESKEILTETSLSTICNAWNALVDFANGKTKIEKIPTKDNPDGENFFIHNDGGKPSKITEFAASELAKIRDGEQSLDFFKGKKKFDNPSGIKNKADVANYIQDGEILKWVMDGQSNKTKRELDKAYQKTYGLSAFVDQLNKASNSEKDVSVGFGSNHQYMINKNNFGNYMKAIIQSLRNPQERLNVCNAMLNNTKNPLSDQYKGIISDWKQQLEKIIADRNNKESTIDNRINSLVESSKKFPWLNEIINKNIITEDDTLGDVTSGFDSAVASAGGMNTSSDSTETTTDTSSETSDLGDLNLDTDAPDLSGGVGGGNNFNFDFDGDNSPAPQKEGPSYVVVDVIFPNPNSFKDSEEETNMDIIVKLKDSKTGEIIEKPLNEVDTL